MKLALLAEAEAEIHEAAAWYDEQRQGLGDELLLEAHDAASDHRSDARDMGAVAGSATSPSSDSQISPAPLSRARSRIRRVLV